MVQSLQLAKHFCRYLQVILDILSRPNANYIHDKIEYEISHMRSKTLLATQFVLIIYFIIDSMINKLPAFVTFVRCGTCLITSGALILSCRFHPIIVKIFYNMLCLCYGPLIMDMGEGGIHRAWSVTHIFPLFLFVFVGDLRFVLFQAVAQMIYLDKIYNQRMERALTFMAPEAFMRSFNYSTKLVLIFYIAAISLAHCFMQHAYRRISAVEKKKDEIESQKTFLLGFSHELRNLINSLTGNVKLATLEVVCTKTRELLLNAEVCGELLLHLVNNILDTGKVEIGELEINPVPARIYETLERIWGICSELIKRKNLGGKIRISKQIPKNLMIDHYRLTQIFLNLVGNAVKFTEAGSIDISVDWLGQNETVDESCFQPYPFNYLDDHDEGLFEKDKTLGYLDKNSFVLGLSSHKISLNSPKHPLTNTSKGVLKIVVSDTGCGMSQEESRKLFHKFTQVTSDSSKRKLGTGLGLFITKELCRRMQGDIQAFSRKGCGSSFIFCIPADIVQEQNDSNIQDIESLREFVKSKKLKAMIVDDVSFNHTILTNFFDKLGIEVVDIAMNGSEALKKYSKLLEKGKTIDIITMDIEMPVMDGKEATKHIRKLEALKRVRPCFLPIISANCSESEITECLNKSHNIRADVFLKKPITLEELLRAIGHHFA